MAALSFKVHSDTTFDRMSFMYNMNALSGFFMWPFKCAKSIPGWSAIAEMLCEVNKLEKKYFIY